MPRAAVAEHDARSCSVEPRVRHVLTLRVTTSTGKPKRGEMRKQGDSNEVHPRPWLVSTSGPALVCWASTGVAIELVQDFGSDLLGAFPLSVGHRNTSDDRMSPSAVASANGTDVRI